MKLRDKQSKFLLIKHTFTCRGDILEFIRELNELKLMYHFDDAVEDVFSWFDDDEMQMFKASIDRMLETAQRLHVNIFDYALRISNRKDPDSDYFECKTEKFETDTVFIRNMYKGLIMFAQNAHEAYGSGDAPFDRDMCLEALGENECTPGSMYELLAFEEAFEEVIGGGNE